MCLQLCCDLEKNCEHSISTCQSTLGQPCGPFMLRFYFACLLFPYLVMQTGIQKMKYDIGQKLNILSQAGIPNWSCESQWNDAR
ncbi:hypothetical protein OUZ56_001251 [Daphnia magna]|uniref:Uncharacterized protein n=1 Tax=Daphnia magna TaxID=35525 RepID=A0ABR0A2P0_9CRUS|nr:hypothetical protein OUZ56_001251 [Daphnia magna]